MNEHNALQFGSPARSLEISYNVRLKQLPNRDLSLREVRAAKFRVRGAGTNVWLTEDNVFERVGGFGE